MSDLKIHNDKAWEIASYWSDVLASDTRSLAAAIDVALAEARDKALEEAAEEARVFPGAAAAIRALKEKP